jgi:hypothetical protein
MLSRVQKHWKWIVLVALALAIYFWATRKTVTKVIGTVDVNGEGMTVNGV